MVDDEHLFPNSQAFNGNPPSSIEGIPDHKLLIKLSGIKELDYQMYPVIDLLV